LLSRKLPSDLEFSFPQADTRNRPKQLKTRITKWKLDKKYAKRDDMIAIARTRLRRRRDEQKESAFHLNNKPMEEMKIIRFLKRKNISEDVLLSMKSPVNGKTSLPPLQKMSNVEY
jgi:hypothetical protein